MNIIKENDRGDFLRVLVIQIFQCCTQLVGIGVLAVYNHNHFFAAVNKLIYAALDVTASIRNLAIFSKVVIMPLIQFTDKLLVVIENIALILRNPVYIHLIWIAEEMGIVEIGSFFRSVFTQTIWHKEQLFNVLPVNPKRK